MTEEKKQDKQQDNRPKQPKIKVRAGGVVATVWENEKEINGNKIQIPSVTIKRTYKDNEGNWQSTDSFQLRDIQKLETVLAEVKNRLLLTKVETQEED